MKLLRTNRDGNGNSFVVVFSRKGKALYEETVPQDFDHLGLNRTDTLITDELANEYFGV